MKTKVSYEVYQKWYRKYAANNEMKSAMLDKKAFMILYRQARFDKEDMTDFSRITAREQRRATELQVQATWRAVKQQLSEFKKDIRSRRTELRREELKDVIRTERGNKFIEETELEKEVKRRLKKGLTEDIKKRAEDALNVELAKKIEFVENYKTITFKQFRLNQKDLTNTARKVNEEREIWDEAFAIAYESPKESKVLK